MERLQEQRSAIRKDILLLADTIRTLVELYPVPHAALKTKFQILSRRAAALTNLDRDIAAIIADDEIETEAEECDYYLEVRIRAEIMAQRHLQQARPERHDVCVITAPALPSPGTSYETNFSYKTDLLCPLTRASESVVDVTDSGINESRSAPNSSHFSTTFPEFEDRPRPTLRLHIGLATSSLTSDYNVLTSLENETPSELTYASGNLGDLEESATQDPREQSEIPPSISISQVCAVEKTSDDDSPSMQLSPLQSETVNTRKVMEATESDNSNRTQSEFATQDIEFNYNDATKDSKPPSDTCHCTPQECAVLPHSRDVHDYSRHTEVKPGLGASPQHSRHDVWYRLRRNDSENKMEHLDKLRAPLRSRIERLAEDIMNEMRGPTTSRQYIRHRLDALTRSSAELTDLDKTASAIVEDDDIDNEAEVCDTYLEIITIAKIMANSYLKSEVSLSAAHDEEHSSGFTTPRQSLSVPDPLQLELIELLALRSAARTESKLQDSAQETSQGNTPQTKDNDVDSHGTQESPKDPEQVFLPSITDPERHTKLNTGMDSVPEENDACMNRERSPPDSAFHVGSIPSIAASCFVLLPTGIEISTLNNVSEEGPSEKQRERENSRDDPELLDSDQRQTQLKDQPSLLGSSTASQHPGQPSANDVNGTTDDDTSHDGAEGLMPAEQTPAFVPDETEQMRHSKEFMRLHRKQNTDFHRQPSPLHSEVATATIRGRLSELQFAHHGTRPPELQRGYCQLRLPTPSTYSAARSV